MRTIMRDLVREGRRKYCDWNLKYLLVISGTCNAMLIVILVVACSSERNRCGTRTNRYRLTGVWEQVQNIYIYISLWYSFPNSWLVSLVHSHFFFVFFFCCICSPTFSSLYTLSLRSRHFLSTVVGFYNFFFSFAIRFAFSTLLRQLPTLSLIISLTVDGLLKPQPENVAFRLSRVEILITIDFTMPTLVISL